MKERVAYFIIDGKHFGLDSTLLDQAPEYNSLNITFDIPYMGNSLVPLPAKFTIDNLTPQSRKHITTNTSIFLKRRRKIQFYAGYKGEERCLFDGEINRAWFEGLPDTTLYIEAWTSLESMGSIVNVRFNSIKAIDLLEDAVKRCKMTLYTTSKVRNHPQLQRIIKGFSFSGSGASAYNYLTRVMKDITGFYYTKNQIIISIQNNVVKVSLLSEQNNKPMDIGYWNGMVGLPVPNMGGVDITMRLDPNFYVGQTVRLESLSNSLYNDEYNIFGTIFRGSLRGDDFYTDLICTRVYKK